MAKSFPRLSETFVSNEVLALRRTGVPVRVYSILPPTRDRLIHPEVESLVAEVVILPQPSWRELPAFVGCWGRCFRAAPGATVKETLRALRRPGPRSFRRFFRGVALAERLRHDRVSHVHAAWAHTPASVSEVASRLTRIPWSMAGHAKDIHTSEEGSLARKLSSARFTLACTAHHRDLLRRITERHARDLPPGDIELAYHGVDSEFFSPARVESAGEESPDAASPPTPAILFVGRLVPKKGVELLVEAVARLRSRGIACRLEIVGEGPLRPSLVRRIGELGLERDVSLRGSMVREEVREAMRRAACFALPCRVTPDGDRDGIPNSLAEAMASGLAVVSSRLPSIEELVENGRSGLLVPPDDPDALALALSQVLLDPDLRRRLGTSAREAVRERFDTCRCEADRVRYLARGTRIARVLYLSGDRGIPIRGRKGASIHVRSLIEAWCCLGVESLVVTASGGPPDGIEPPAEVRETRAGPRFTRAAKILAWCFGGSGATERAWLRIVDNWALFRIGSEAAATWRPDIIYERYALSSIAGSILARRLGVPHVLEVNAPLADEEARYRGLSLARITRALEGWTLRRAHLVVVVSQALERHARGLGVKPERIRVLPNGVDPAIFHPGLDGRSVRDRLGVNGEFVVGFSGSLKPWHGVHHLMRGFASAARAHPAMRLLILGEGPERPALEELAREEGVADRVLFQGAVPHAEMGTHLAACDVLCAPYGPLEQFYFSPMKIAEYLATGRPVIASESTDLKRSLGTGARDVIWTVPGDEAAIGRELLDLAQNPGTRPEAPPDQDRRVRTWSDVARATLLEAELARQRLWRWHRNRAPVVGYVLKMFPRFSETFILDEILELERQGMRVVLFSMKSPTESVQQPGVERIRAPVIVLEENARSRRHRVASHLVSFLRSPGRYTRTAAFAAGRRNESAWAKFLHAPVLAREAHRLGVTHLHAHFANAPTRQAKFASMLSGIPFSFTAHAKDLYWSGNEHAACRKLKHRIRLAKFAVAISNHNREFLVRADARVGPDRILTVYNGIDLEAWPCRRPNGRPISGGEPSSLEDTGPIILAVGRLVEKKGFHVLLDSLGILQARGSSFRCWIAGDGPERARLQSTIVATGLDRAVKILGAIPRDRLARNLYLRAHVLALPSIIATDGDKDGIPTVLLEAMATGLPVVTTPVSGIGEAVLQGETGLLTEPNDAPALAGALSRAIGDDDLVARIAAGARRRIEERFDLRSNVSRLASKFTHAEVR